MHSFLHLRRAHGSGASRAHSASLTYCKDVVTVPLLGSRVQDVPQGFRAGQKDSRVRVLVLGKTFLLGSFHRGFVLGKRFSLVHS